MSSAYCAAWRRENWGKSFFFFFAEHATLWTIWGYWLPKHYKAFFIWLADVPFSKWHDVLYQNWWCFKWVETIHLEDESRCFDPKCWDFWGCFERLQRKQLHPGSKLLQLQLIKGEDHMSDFWCPKSTKNTSQNYLSIQNLSSTSWGLGPWHGYLGWRGWDSWSTWFQRPGLAKHCGVQDWVALQVWRSHRDSSKLHIDIVGLKRPKGLQKMSNFSGFEFDFVQNKIISEFACPFSAICQFKLLENVFSIAFVKCAWYWYELKIIRYVFICILYSRW